MLLGDIVCDGISVLRVSIPDRLFERFNLQRLIHRRSDIADEELWFLFGDRSLKAACLPVLRSGQVEIIEWGNRNNRPCGLPVLGLCPQEAIDKGLWRWSKPEKVTILANLGLVNGVWFTIEHGIEGIVVHDRRNRPHVYMLTAVSTHYSKIMTGCDRSPILVKQVI